MAPSDLLLDVVRLINVLTYLLTYLLTYILTSFCQLSRSAQLVSSVSGRRHLRSARPGELDFPRVNLAMYGGRRLPMPVGLHLGTLYMTVSNINLTLQTFKHQLNMFLFSSY